LDQPRTTYLLHHDQEEVDVVDEEEDDELRRLPDIHNEHNTIDL
jgi:hypothetical protein